MKRINKSLMAVILTFTLIMANLTSAFALNSTNVDEVKTQMTDTANYIKSLYSESSPGIFDYKQIILMMRSGIDCSELTEQYLKTVSDSFTDGKLNIEGASSITLYSGLLIILALDGKDATDFNGYNIINLLNDEIKQYDTTEELTNAIGNPYYYEFVIYALFSYSDYMNDSDDNKKKVLDSLLTYYNNNENGAGIDYYGFSADNNNACISALNLYSDDDSVKEKVNASIKFNKSLMSEDGGTKFDNSAYSTFSNGNSTGGALYLYSSVANSDYAALSFEGLMLLKGTQTGAFSYMNGDTDNVYATLDALKGLVAYNRLLNNDGNVFDVTKEVADIYNPTTEETTENETKETTTAATKETVTTTNSTVSENTTAKLDSTAATTTLQTSPSTGDSQFYLYFVLTLCAACAVTVVLSKKSDQQGK